MDAIKLTLETLASVINNGLMILFNFCETKKENNVSLFSLKISPKYTVNDRTLLHKNHARNSYEQRSNPRF
jgi:hypothetical protein